MRRALLVTFLFALIGATLPPRAHTAPYREVEVCFVLDTTGSMQSMIDAAKEKIWFIANEIVAAPSKPVARFCLIGFRDRGDAYVTRRFDLTADLDAIYRELLAFQADGGGDTPEAVNQALFEAVELTRWSNAPEVLRVIFLVGDAPPQRYEGEPQYGEIAALARRRGILINPVLCGSDDEARRTWRSIAGASAGESAELGDTVAVMRVETPLDQDLASLSYRLGASLVPYGDDAARTRLLEAEATARTLDDAGSADRMAYKSRAAPGTADLIDALDSGALAPAAIERDKLPDGLRSMNESELLTHLETVRSERAELKRVIAALVAEREARIAELRRGKEGGFDTIVAGIVRRQLAGTDNRAD
jgi:hypothetical protein